MTDLHAAHASAILCRYNDFIDTINGLGLQNDVDSKPLLNVGPHPSLSVAAQHSDPLQGQEIKHTFGVTKIGPWVGKVLEDVVEWQLAHPSGSKEECIKWLKGCNLDSYTSGEPEPKNPPKRLRTK